VVLPFDEWGAPTYHSYTWAVREDTIERNPVLVSTIVNALVEGYRIALVEPQRAVDALQRNLLNVHPSIIRESLALVSPTWTRDGRRWGEFDPKLLESYAQWLVDNGLLASVDPLAGAVTSQFIDQAYR
jgi:NitT/TauT family transport system substrate-binding protein